MERKALDFEIKALDEESGVIEGLASAFRSEPDAYGDRVRPGSFTRTLMARGSKVKVLFCHDSTQMIGKPIEMREDGAGLFARLQLFLHPDIPEGRKAYALAKLGALDSLSIGFSPMKWDMREDGGRDLTEIKLYEVSLVPFPADDKALITAVKTMPEDTMIDRLSLIADELKAGRRLSATSLAKARAAAKALLDLLGEDGLDDEDEGAKGAPLPLLIPGPDDPRLWTSGTATTAGWTITMTNTTNSVPEALKGLADSEPVRPATTQALRAKALEIEIALARLRAA